MFTKNALSITCSRFTLIYKVMVYFLIIILLFSVIGFAILQPTLGQIKAEIKQLDVSQSVTDYFKSLIKGGVNENDGEPSLEHNKYYQAMIADFDAIAKIFTENAKALNIGIFLLVMLFYLFGIAYYLLFLPATTVIYHFMSNGCKLGFATCYLTEFKKSILFAFISATFASLYSVASFAIAFLLYKLFALMSGFVAIAIAYAFLGMAWSMRRALTFAWLPAIVVDNKKVFPALLHSIKLNKKHFFRTTLIFFTMFLVLSCAFFMATIATFGVGLIFAFGFNLVFFCCMDMVLYYHNSNRKYYKDEQTVVDPNRKYGNAVLENPLKVEED